MAWKRIIKPLDKRVAKNTIGKVVKETQDYYYLQHHHYADMTIQVRKIDTENFTPQIGLTVSYSSFPINFKITKYLDDHKTGANTYTSFTGLRVEIVPVSSTDAQTNNINQSYEVYIDQLTFL